MEERHLLSTSTEISKPTKPLPRNPKALALTNSNIANSSYIQLGRDVHSVVLDNCPTIRDAVNLASCCFTLWSKSQGTLFNRLLREAHNRSDVSGLGYLADMIEFNPTLRQHGINYQHLATILTRARTLVDTTIRTDPYCAWKIAAMCGLKHLVRQLLGSEIVTKMDQYGRGVLAYYALGGQLACIKAFIEEHGLPIPLDLNTLSVLARMAAIGGHIHVLEYLRDIHGFKLNHIYEGRQEETLLRAAVIGGDKNTVDFLKRAEHEIDRDVDINLAFIASGCGHWALYEEFAEENNPVDNVDDAKVIASDAVRHGNLKLAIELLEKYSGEDGIDPKTLALDVINGGDPTTFRYALEKGWFKLTDTFDRGASVEHLLARQGHIDLLKAVLNDKKALKAIDPLVKGQKQKATCVLDDFLQTPFHYAASGGQWNICRNKSIPLDFHGNTIAHCAARAGSVWFLKHLFNSENGPALIQQRDNNGGSILHDAAHACESNILIMIIEEFNIDVKSADRWGNTVLHILAKLAVNDLTYWDVIADIVARYPHERLLDIPTTDPEAKTVRQLIAEGGEEVGFPEHLLIFEMDQDDAHSADGEKFSPRN